MLYWLTIHIYTYIHLTADTNNMANEVQYKYFNVLYSSYKESQLPLIIRTLAASGAFLLKPKMYSADLISLGSNKIVVWGFSVVTTQHIPGIL